MTENMTNMQLASTLVSRMIRYVELYEAGVATVANDFTVTFTQQQIQDLKQAFATARTECIDALNAVSG